MFTTGGPPTLPLVRPGPPRWYPTRSPWFYSLVNCLLCPDYLLFILPLDHGIGHVEFAYFQVFDWDQTLQLGFDREPTGAANATPGSRYREQF